MIDQRVSNVFVTGKTVGELAAELQGLFQVGLHRSKVVRRTGLVPYLECGSGMVFDLGQELGRDLDRLLIVAACDADQAGIVRVKGQTRLVELKLVEQFAQRRIDELFVGQPL